MFGNMYSYIMFVCIALPIQSLPSISWLYGLCVYITVYAVYVPGCLCVRFPSLWNVTVSPPPTPSPFSPIPPIVPGYSPPPPPHPNMLHIRGTQAHVGTVSPLFARIAEVPLQTSFFSMHTYLHISIATPRVPYTVRYKKASPCYFCKNCFNFIIT
jgi:hypothetical protein